MSQPRGRMSRVSQPRDRCLASALVVALALSAAAPAAGAPPTLGPWPVSEATYAVPRLDATDPSVWLVFPVCNLTAPADCPKFPLLSYSHGLAGGDIDLLGYAQHFFELASYGFVVAAPDSCDFGCTDPSNGAPYTDCAGGVMPPSPVGEHWSPWFGEQLKTIEWARNQTSNATGDAVFRTIDWDAGVGIVGHSMGGQATSLSASPACASRWGVRAAVLHHPYDGSLPGGGNLGVNVSVPVAAFTSSGDPIWPDTQALMAAANASAFAVPRAYRDLTGSSHLEPVLVPPIENPFLATFTAAWFKVFLVGDRGFWYDLVFGSGPDSLCNHANMTACYVINSP